MRQEIQNIIFVLLATSVLFGCDTFYQQSEAITKAQNHECAYPKIWWQGRMPNEDPAASWEIMPDTVRCDQQKVVLSKRRALGIFSNFSHTPFVFEGKRYASVEGFWQMMKFPEGPSDERVQMDPGFDWKYTRDQLAAMSAFEAKAAGDYAKKHMQKHGYNWVSYRGNNIEYRTLQKGAHYNLIRSAMQAKLDQTKGLKVL